MLDFILTFFSDIANVRRVSNQLLLAGLVMLVGGTVAAYGLEEHLTLFQLIVAHAGTIVGPTLLKIGYVMRLAAHYGERKAEQAECCTVA
ncbi:transmembrane sensor/regulator PpyR [Pseudomonas sp. GD03944]|uniref:transmembrane sensor/regulator PpyR n=1 Tax=Pseudomonas sp. GD03944 TaxID=2975409 RepID=UPI0024474974|nr:transmembrane sensor/regulator PpyR [Pseudomonas sp. GD03944]MDH1261881.1 transmembrane sensor/regulator PpyR [Pseudomonas sp. GD03944]HWV08092.1 transmembrane sensor/regulator PpyR [Pseudomonas sp.]